MNVRTGDPHLITAADLANAILPVPPKEVIGNGQIAIVAAQYGRGKTPLLTQMALEAACSLELTPLGLHTCRAPALVFDAESNPSAYRAMLARLMQAVGIEAMPGNLHLWFKLDLALTPGSASEDALKRLVAKLQPGLLVLDPLRQFSNGHDLLKPRHALLFMDALRAIQSEAPKLRIAMPHHLTKRDLKSEIGALADDPWAWLERVSGSLALLDHADVRLGFEEENGKLVLAGIKRGVGIVGPWHFTTEENSLGEPCRFRFENREHSLNAGYVAFLEKLPDSYQWHAGRVALGIGESTMHRFTQAVTQAGLVVQGPDKVYRKVEGRK